MVLFAELGKIYLPPFEEHYRPMIPPAEGNDPLWEVFVKKIAHFHFIRRQNCVTTTFSGNSKFCRQN